MSHFNLDVLIQWLIRRMFLTLWWLLVMVVAMIAIVWLTHDVHNNNSFRRGLFWASRSREGRL